MLVQEDFDSDIVFLARGAPTSWYQQEEQFGIAAAPTRFGIVSYTIRPSQLSATGSVTLNPHPNAALKSAEYHIRIPSGHARSFKQVEVQGAKLLSYCKEKEMAIFQPTGLNFSFTVTFDA